MVDITAVIPLINNNFGSVSYEYVIDYYFRKCSNKYSQLLIIGQSEIINSFKDKFINKDSVKCIFNENDENLDVGLVVLQSLPFIKTQFYQILNNNIELYQNDNFDINKNTLVIYNKKISIDLLEFTSSTYDDINDFDKVLKNIGFEQTYWNFLSDYTDSEEYIYRIEECSSKNESKLPWTFLQKPKRSKSKKQEPVDDPAAVGMFFIIMGILVFLMYIGVYVIFGIHPPKIT
jgi:hypothetical protein